MEETQRLPVHPNESAHHSIAAALLVFMSDPTSEPDLSFEPSGPLSYTQGEP